jgi:hypothetical protein
MKYWRKKYFGVQKTQVFPDCSVIDGWRNLATAMSELCDSKTELLLAYQKTAGAYSKAVSELVRHAGTIPAMEYERLRVVTERARRACANARDTLAVHTIEHGC